VALVGYSMGGITAIASVGVLGDGTLTAADADPAAPRAQIGGPRPRIVAVVGDSVAPEVALPVASRIGGPGPLRRFIADRLFDGAASVLGADPRATEPARVIGLVEPVPLLLIHGTGDRTVPIVEGRRLASRAGEDAEHWVVDGADHCASHQVNPSGYEAKVTGFLRDSFHAARPVTEDMMAKPVEGTGIPVGPHHPGEV
jgi:pimeloyl-ACP methyl ester carboxylesterase